jgi:hypothetical protein
MWAIAGILLSGCFIAVIEAPYLIQKKLKKELCIFFLLLLTGMAVCILQSLRLKLPNPLDWITAMYEPFSEFVFDMLK